MFAAVSSGGMEILMFHVVLLEPEIPQNTGNIGRTCVASGCSLHLIEPMGFQINEKSVKRAGLDYWSQLALTMHDSYRDFTAYYENECRCFCEKTSPADGNNFSKVADGDNFSKTADGALEKSGSSLTTARKPRIFMATTKARRTYADVRYCPGDYIMFGKESAGIPEEILVEHEEDCIRIPMIGQMRSLNLSNSVAIVLYEALRQNRFTDMNTAGQLHRLQW